MIKFFLLFVLMIFGIVFLLGGLTVFKVLRRIQDIKQQFNNAGRQGQQRHRKTNGNNAYGNNAYDNSSYNAEGISDSRSHADRNKKIIPKDEGEYVDFVEEK